MNLLIISSRYPYPLEKGDKLRLYHQIRELSEYHKITLVSISDEPISDTDHRALDRYVCHQYHFNITAGIRMYNRMMALITGLPIQVSQLYDRSIMAAVRQISVRHHIEHIYCQLPRAAEYARRLDIPKTIDYMDAFGESMERRAKLKSGFWKFLYRMEARRMRKYESSIFVDFDHHTLISEQDKSYMDIPNPDMIGVVPNGIDTDFFSYGLNEFPTTDMAFVGNMGYLPNVESVVYLVNEIMPLLRSQKTLMISGARPTTQVLELASDMVSISGWVDDIRDAYRNAKIFVAPIFAGTGQQNKILEAMAIGLPCITTTQVNNAIVAKPEKEVIIANNPTEFAIAITRLLNDRSHYENIQKNARRFVQNNYSWKEHVDTLNELMQSTTKK